ncbi:MAG: hypothetical protein IKH80_02480 [Bacteroidaceae bacterium]|jgi:hypothetical protein|nr:hypothetical protein [Bacteroidaceae bacterium]
MSTTAKASEHIKPCNIAQCERHNRRDADYIASLNPARLYIRTELTRDNETYVAPDMVGITLQQHYDNLKALVKEKTGRAMQEKDVEYTDKKGVKRVRKGSSPIREGVVNIKPDTTMDDLLQYAERVHERWGIRAIQIHMHKDEGHYENPEDKSTWQPNLHAHIIWDWIDHATGKSYKLNAEDMSEIQDMVAETLDMQRGLKKSETGLDHLERNDFIIQKQENKKKQLQKEAQKAITEKEEAEAKVETAKAEVADLWKAHDLLTDSNRTKKERSNHLDLDIRTKMSRSKSLDETIDAKEKKINQLEEKANEKLQDLYTIKEHGDWQNPMFFGMSAYIYRFDEGLQFCIKAIQDFAYSGFGCRGGKHGDIFWDNESLAIKQYMKMFADLASATLKQVANWFVWLASTLGKFNANELKRAHNEVQDIADGRYDGRIQKYQQGVSR